MLWRYLVIAFTVTLNGCFMNINTYPMQINIADKMSDYYASNLVLASYRAYADLRDCKHPALFNKDGSSKVLNKGLDKLEFRLESPEDQASPKFCAYTYIYHFQNVIWLSKDESKFSSKRCDFTRVIKHEMLHLVGFDHGFLMDEVLDYCGGWPEGEL